MTEKHFLTEKHILAKNTTTGLKRKPERILLKHVFKENSESRYFYIFFRCLAYVFEGVGGKRIILPFQTSFRKTSPIKQMANFASLPTSMEIGSV